jgi:hypothetical protein
MALRMLLALQLQQERRHLREHDLGATDLGTTGWAKRNHQVERLPRHPMMNDDRAFASPRCASSELWIGSNESDGQPHIPQSPTSV